MELFISDFQPVQTDRTTNALHSAALLRIEQLTVCAPDGTDLAIQLITFDSKKFRLEDFAGNGIECPAGITRSVHKRRAEFYFGRLAARHALSMLNIGAINVPMGRMREPVWPAGIVGSISHAQTRAAAVALRRCVCSGVGLDLERVVEADTCAVLSATVIDDGELQYLNTFVGALPLSTLLTIVFSAKESFFKGACAAVGRYFDFDVVRVIHVDLARRCIQLVLVETLCDAFAKDQVCEIGFYFVESGTVLTHFSW